ncbi:B12-binding domain/radical SAM domain-containing protein [Agrobacterium vitis]|uniref:B12-binding domain/radical SAM domain-containing protein n=1 Tax=Agrobacterium vitis TaxID=373 RepID=A0A6L6VP98_AGRVI|nr:B12-binding domain/radical SAM domain-containing protein [Agrobacterium vitis]MUZ75272.1 B12-binding domain/radical SAM domain-containing protein [Agrobacterium vitis]
MTSQNSTTSSLDERIPTSQNASKSDLAALACKPLRVLAVAAPDRIAGRKNSLGLDSTDPASLFNACRIAAQRTFSVDSAWAQSNWAGGRKEIRKHFALLYSLDDLPSFTEMLLHVRPNLLLIGAMTLCMPGAVECARRARDILGNEVIIVLGGRHATETIYLSPSRIRTPEKILHHRASPILLARTGRISGLFDAVVSGEGEYLIAEIGEIIASIQGTCDVTSIIRNLAPETPGDWILSTVDPNNEVVSTGVPIDRNILPPLAPLFGVSAAFDVFKGRMTAHVFSDTGPGCVYDCSFCSERSGVTGRLADLGNAPTRLYRQLAEAAKVIDEDSPGRGASAFVEDSVLLGGSPRSIDLFCDLLEADPIPIQFGAQLTIDQILRRETQVMRLARVGLKYLFIGLETFDPVEIGGMSKDLGSREGSWHLRFRRALDVLGRFGVACGCALLFGLGEAHASRIALLEAVVTERAKRGNPLALSANWAVHHPLRGQVSDPGFDYLKWGTPEGPMLELFHNFGEASTEYCLVGTTPPNLEEVKEINQALEIFWKNGDSDTHCTSRPDKKT